MPIKLLARIRLNDRELAPGDEIDLPRGRAIELVEAKKAEPALPTKPYEPAEVRTNCTLREIWRIYIENHPAIASFGPIKLPPRRITVSKYKEAPRWSQAIPWQVSLAAYNTGFHPALDDSFDDNLLGYALRSAIHNLLRLFATGKLKASGVLEKNSATLVTTNVPAALWEVESIRVDFDKGSIEEVLRKPRRINRLYSRVDATRVYAHPSKSNPSALKGQLGKPTLRPIIDAKIMELKSKGAFKGCKNLKGLVNLVRIAVKSQLKTTKDKGLGHETIRRRLRELGINDDEQ